MGGEEGRGWGEANGTITMHPKQIAEYPGFEEKQSSGKCGLSYIIMTWH